MKGNIWNCELLDRGQPIFQDYIEMELQETPCGSCYASICHETTHKIQSRCPLETTALPVFTQSHQIWQKQPIALSPWQKSLPRQSTKETIQQFFDSFLYHAQAVNHTILMALLEIACNKQHQLRMQWNMSINFLIACGHIQMQLSGTVPLTWFSTFTLMRCTSLHQKLAAVLVAASSLAVSHTKETQLNWIEPFISHVPSSSLLLLPQHKQN